MNIYLEAFSIFFKIGAFTIGGGYAMVPLIENEIVTKRNWIAKEDFIDLLAISQSAPGILAVNISIFIGYRLRGIRGSIITALGTILPSFLLSRLSAFASRLTAHSLYHLLFALSRTFLFYFLSSFFICISNSDIISCLQFPVNTFFIFFSTLFNQISVVCQKKSASLRSGFIISLFSFCVKYYFTFFYIFFTLSPISL